MSRQGRHPAELRERVVRMVLEHRNEYQSESAAIRSIGEKLGVHHESIRIWVRRAQVDAGARAGLTTEERERLRLLEREVRELRRANEIIKSASLFFATELGGRRPLRSIRRPVATRASCRNSLARCRRELLARRPWRGCQ